MTLTPPAAVWIDTPEQLAEFVAFAARQPWLALDTEADSFHSYYHKLCLVQLSSGGRHALVDTLALRREDVTPLVELLADPDVVTLMHGADYDLRVLDRDLGAKVRAIRDTQLAAQLLGEPSTGLAALAQRELQVELDKRFQRADWAERPLSPAARAYAAMDTALLEELAIRLEARLQGMGRVSWWLEECCALEDVRWLEPVQDGLAFERLKGARRLRGASRDRLAALFAWRELLARERDVAPFRILGNETLMALALAPPEDMAAMQRAPGMPKALVRNQGEVLRRLLTEPPPAPAPPSREATRPDQLVQTRVKRLRSVRDEAAADLGLEPGVVAPRAVLEAIAAQPPGSPEELVERLGRRWRAEVLGGRIAPILAEWSSSPVGE